MRWTAFSLCHFDFYKKENADLNTWKIPIKFWCIYIGTHSQHFIQKRLNVMLTNLGRNEEIMAPHMRLGFLADQIRQWSAHSQNTFFRLGLECYSNKLNV